MFSIPLTNHENLNTLIVYFLTKQPVKHIHWNKLFPQLSSEEQEEIIRKTVDFELVLLYPISVSYQKQFLKTFIDYLTLQESVIEDAVYVAYGRLVEQPTNSNFNYVFYPIKNVDNTRLELVIVKENINIISEGTTGLRTWEASLALAEWILQNPSFVENKRILELGAGIGLTGLVIGQSTKPSKYFLTDCHPSVLSVLRENLDLNIKTDQNNRENACEFQVSDLAWEETTKETCENYGQIDCIFAADVLFDMELFEPLLNTIITFFRAGTKEAILAYTERNLSTLKEFWDICDRKSFKIDFLQTPKALHLTWESMRPIYLVRFQPS